MSNKDRALEMLSFMIEVSSSQDEERKKQSKAKRAGESWMTFNLKIVKELIENDRD